MNLLSNFLRGRAHLQYIEAGFSEEQASAMAWIASQKLQGRFVGAVSGAFLAASWGHWHDRITELMRVHFSKRISQFGLLALGVAIGDYLYTARRYGADEYIATSIGLNTNMLYANLDNLSSKFVVMNRKFTNEEIEIFNERATAKSSMVDLKNRKWSYNPKIYTEDEFKRRVSLMLHGPWKNPEIIKAIREANPDNPDLVLSPTNIKQLISSQGANLGISHSWNFGLTPLK